MDADKKKFLKSWMRTTIEVLQLSKDDIVSIVDEVFADVANPKSTGAEIDSDGKSAGMPLKGESFHLIPMPILIYRGWWRGVILILMLRKANVV